MGHNTPRVPLASILRAWQAIAEPKFQDEARTSLLPMKSPQDTYVEGVVARRLPAAIAAGSLNQLVATIKGWANQYLLEIKASGSYAKGTAVAGSADIDLLISLRNDALSGRTPTLSDIYYSLKNWLRVCPKTSGGITKFSEHEAD